MSCTMKWSHGWTLVESLVTLTVISILIGASLPTFRNTIQTNRDRNTLPSLQRLAHYARTQAITRSEVVTLCPSEDGQICSDNWDNPILVFSDNNTNEIVDPDDILLLRRNLPPHTCIELRASANRNYLQFKPSGGSNGIAGHFRFCESVRPEHDKRMVIALTGRTLIRDH